MSQVIIRLAEALHGAGPVVLSVYYWPRPSESENRALAGRTENLIWRGVLSQDKQKELSLSAGSYYIQAEANSRYAIVHAFDVSDDKSPVTIDVAPTAASTRQRTRRDADIPRTQFDASAMSGALRQCATPIRREEMPETPIVTLWKCEAGRTEPEKLSIESVGERIPGDEGWRLDLRQFCQWRLQWNIGRGTPIIQVLPPDLVVVELGAESHSLSSLSAAPRAVEDAALLGAVRVRTANQEADTFFDFLSAGMIGNVREIAQSIFEAEDWLSERLDQPTAALAGAYFLLDSGELDRLGKWIELSLRYKATVPDIAILDAMCRLSADLDAAIHALLEVRELGLPLFTKGLRLAYDYSRLLWDQRPSQTELKELINWLEAYASCACWSQRLTTFTGRTPTSPTRE